MNRMLITFKADLKLNVLNNRNLANWILHKNENGKSVMMTLLGHFFSSSSKKKLSRCPKLDGYTIANIGVRVEQGGHKL